ncbi:hypothetical protein DMUE_0775 [Dictyocoela muelleri]|nr:hypothetical protein DMUE_0775 [Dictyocoela muelleri]
MSKEKSELTTLINETHDLVNALGMKINFDKSATNCGIEIYDKELLKDKYKYLGIIENFGCQISDINLKLIEEKVLQRLRAPLRFENPNWKEHRVCFLFHLDFKS